jgi:3-oxoacyl-[acyl-carrier protein] reductase
VEVLAKELDSRGITATRSFLPMRRAASLKDVADTAEYLVSDLASYISGQHLLLSGGAPA